MAYKFYLEFFGPAFAFVAMMTSGFLTILVIYALVMFDNQIAKVDFILSMGYTQLYVQVTLVLCTFAYLISAGTQAKEVDEEPADSERSYLLKHMS